MNRLKIMHRIIHAHSTCSVYSMTSEWFGWPPVNSEVNGNKFSHEFELVSVRCMPCAPKPDGEKIVKIELSVAKLMARLKEISRTLTLVCLHFIGSLLLHRFLNAAHKNFGNRNKILDRLIFKRVTLYISTIHDARQQRKRKRVKCRRKSGYSVQTSIKLAAMWASVRLIPIDNNVAVKMSQLITFNNPIYIVNWMSRQSFCVLDCSGISISPILEVQSHLHS